MSKKEDLVQDVPRFERVVRRWLEIEEATIGSCDALLEKAASPLVGGLVRAMRADARKHKELLALLEGCLAGRVEVRREEVVALEALLDTHARVEREAVAAAKTALADSRHPIVSLIVRYILADEMNHLSVATDLGTQAKSN